MKDPMVTFKMSVLLVHVSVDDNVASNVRSDYHKPSSPLRTRLAWFPSTGQCPALLTKGGKGGGGLQTEPRNVFLVEKIESKKRI